MSDTVHSLFPTAVYQTSLNRKFTQKEILFLDKQKNNLTKIEGNSKTNNSYILNEKPLKQLKDDLTNASYKYYKNIFATYNWWIPVKSGDILFFPSYLNHSVETKQDNNLRISLAFNTFVKGSIGSREGLSELNL